MLRSQIELCADQVARPGYELVYGDQRCEKHFEVGNFDTDIYYGAPYKYFTSELDIRTKYEVIPNQGNSLDLKIKEEDGTI
jgi:hypothetical protein